MPAPPPIPGAPTPSAAPTPVVAADHGAPPFESLTIFYPMWNEEATLDRAVDAAIEAGDDLVAEGEIGRFDVLLIDDASTDRTPELADARASADPRVSVIHHERNRKLGGSLKTGFANATGELVLYTDADLPFDMAEVHKAVRLLRIYEADIVSAYRFDRTGEGARRLVYSYVYNHMVQALFGLRLRDMNFAFKLLRRSVLDHVELRSEGSFIDVELLARAQRLGFHIVQFGVDYFPRTRGISTLSSNAVILHLLREMRDLRGELAALRPLSDDVRRGADG
jgi:glycosyltransferase involved in cell wall biosynthesis